jgi:hypothetical protein
MFDTNIKPMKILLLYPKYPDTFWSFKYALKFIFKKAANPPLGFNNNCFYAARKMGEKIDGSEY